MSQKGNFYDKQTNYYATRGTIQNHSKGVT